MNNFPTKVSSMPLCFCLLTHLQLFFMDRTKLSYLMACGLGQTFEKQILYDVRRSNRPLSLQCDKTTQSQVKKPMEIGLQNMYIRIIHNSFGKELAQYVCE